jgi:hypothetical protein
MGITLIFLLTSTILQHEHIFVLIIVLSTDLTMVDSQYINCMEVVIATLFANWFITLEDLYRIYKSNIKI